MLPATIDVAKAATGGLPAELIIDASNAHPKPDAKLVYGTAGFRTKCVGCTRGADAQCGSARQHVFPDRANRCAAQQGARWEDDRSDGDGKPQSGASAFDVPPALTSRTMA